MNSPVLLKIVCTTCDAADFAVYSDMTIGETKTLIRAQLVTENDDREIRMTFRGELLMRDDECWGSKAPRGGEKLFVSFVRASHAGIHRVPEPAPERSNGMLAMMESIEQMASNPQFIETMINMSPELRDLARTNPDVANELRNPETFRTMLRAQFDPHARRQLDISMQSQMAQLGAIPGGLGMLERAANGALRDLDRPAARSAADLNEATEVNALPRAGQVANNAQLPNPWAQRAPQAIPLAPAQRATERYPAAAAALQDMGFDAETIERALTASGGSVEGAVEYIERVLQ